MPRRSSRWIASCSGPAQLGSRAPQAGPCYPRGRKTVPPCLQRQLCRHLVLSCKLAGDHCVERGLKQAQNNHPRGDNLHGGFHQKLEGLDIALPRSLCFSNGIPRHPSHALGSCPGTKQVMGYVGGVQEGQRVHLL